MNLPDIPLLSMLTTRMSWLSRRQDVLTQNVANADTPGYVAEDLKPQDFSQALKGFNSPGLMRAAASPLPMAGHLAVTDPRHLTGAAAAGGSDFQTYQTRDVEADPGGNAVSLEQEMIKVADNQAQFQAAANLYAKAMTLMKTAIGH